MTTPTLTFLNWQPALNRPIEKPLPNVHVGFIQTIPYSLVIPTSCVLAEASGLVANMSNGKSKVTLKLEKETRK